MAGIVEGGRIEGRHPRNAALARVAEGQVQVFGSVLEEGWPTGLKKAGRLAHNYVIHSL